MTIDEFAKTLIVQLPNFAGLIICIVVMFQIIMRQQAQIESLNAKINEMCEEKGEKLEQMLEKGQQ